MADWVFACTSPVEMLYKISIHYDGIYTTFNVNDACLLGLGDFQKENSNHVQFRVKITMVRGHGSPF